MLGKRSGSAEGAKLIAAHYPPALVDPTPVVMRFDEPVWQDLEAVARAERELRQALNASAGRLWRVTESR